MATNRYKTVLKKIILKLGKGLKSSKKEYCLGEEIDLQLEEIIVPSEGVKAVPPTDLNTLARWNKSDGSELTGSRTTQDNEGNTTTTSTVDGELKELLENLSSSDAATVVYHLRSLVKTMIRQEIKDKQIWDAYIDATSKSYVVRGENLEDPNQKGNFFEITRRGATKSLNQPEGLIVLETNTGAVIGANNWYRLGTKETWKVIKDNYNIFTSLGGSAANPLKAVINEGGTYQFKIGTYLRTVPTEARQTTLQFRILTKGREYFSFGSMPAGLTDGYLSDNIGVIADINDELLFEIWGGISGPKIAIEIRGTPWPILYTGIFYYLMG